MQSSVVQATHLLGLAEKGRVKTAGWTWGAGEAGEDLLEEICGGQASQQQLVPSAEVG